MIYEASEIVGKRVCKKTWELPGSDYAWGRYWFLKETNKRLKTISLNAKESSGNRRSKLNNWNSLPKYTGDTPAEFISNPALPQNCSSSDRGVLGSLESRHWQDFRHSLLI